MKRFIATILCGLGFLGCARAQTDVVTVTGQVTSAMSTAFTNTIITFTPDNSGPIIDNPFVVTADPVTTTSTAPVGYFEADLEQGVYQVRIAGSRANTFKITIPADTTTTNHIANYITSGATTNFIAGGVSGWTQTAADARYVLKTNSWSTGQSLTNVIIGSGWATNLILTNPVVYSDFRIFPGAGTSNFVWTLTNATTGQGEWRVNPGAGGGEANVNGEISLTNATTMGLVYGKAGITNLLRSLRAGANVVLTNEGTNITIASTASGGGNLQTNANQFAADLVLTIKDQARLTNMLGYQITMYSNILASADNSWDIGTALSQFRNITARNGTFTNLTLWGNGQFVFTQVTPSRVAVWSSSQQLTNSAAVDLTELEYLDGLSEALTTSLGNLQGATNGLSTDVGNLQGATNGLDALVRTKQHGSATLTNLAGTGAITNLTQLGTTNLSTSYSVISNVVNGSGSIYSLVEGSNITIDQTATGLVFNASGGSASSNYVNLLTENLYLTNFVEFYWAQAAAGALTWSEGARQFMELGANTNITGPDMSGAITNREPMVLAVRQDGTGSRTFTHNGTAYQVRDGANEFTFFTIYPGPDGSTNVSPEMFNSAGLAAAIEDETGTGSLVLSNAPTINTPSLIIGGTTYTFDFGTPADGQGLTFHSDTTTITNETVGGSGEVNTGSNLGDTNNTDRFGVFVDKNSLDLRHRTISAGLAITLTNESTNIVIATTDWSTDISNLQGATNGLAADIAQRQFGSATLTNLSGTGAITNLNANQFSGTTIYSIKTGAALTNLNAQGLGTNSGNFYVIGNLNSTSITNGTYRGTGDIGTSGEVTGSKLINSGATANRLAIIDGSQNATSSGHTVANTTNVNFNGNLTSMSLVTTQFLTTDSLRLTSTNKTRLVTIDVGETSPNANTNRIHLNLSTNSLAVNQVLRVHSLTHTSSGTDITLTNATPSGGGLGYTLLFGNDVGMSPADSTTYYVGSAWANNWRPGVTDVEIYVPASGTITRCTMYMHSTGATSSSENVTNYVCINSDASRTASWTSLYNATRTKVDSGALSLAVTAGDTICVRVDTPAWVTNPTAVYLSGHIYIQ